MIDLLNQIQHDLRDIFKALEKHQVEAARNEIHYLDMYIERRKTDIGKPTPAAEAELTAV